jgi:ribosomal protein S18 acetylase RimI-like enzyme
MEATLAEQQPETADIAFRAATEDDLPQLRRLYAQLIPDESPSIEDMRDTLAEIVGRPEAGMIVVGSIDEYLVATCQVVIYPNLVRTPRVKAQIDSVVVDQGYRGRGIGRQMMQWSMARLQERHCAKIIVATSYTRDVAHKLYATLGFEEFGYSFVYSDRH